MTSAKQNRPLSRGRRWCFRLGAMGLGLLAVGAIELACRVFGVGLSAGVMDAGFDPERSLFVTNAAGNGLEVRPSRLKFFRPVSFPAVKGSNVFRIFCLGGSTVQGRPYATETAFSSWLQLGLTAADPGRTWEVINCGGVSYASYRLTLILQECLSHEPDLIILCTGHNEFLEERTYASQRRAPRVLVRAHERLMGLRIYALLQAGMMHLRGPAAREAGSGRMSDEVDALLDYRDGLKAYRRDPAWREKVVRRFEANVGTMLAMSRRAGVAMVLMLPPTNLGDSPPFKSQHRDGLSGPDLEQWEGSMREAAAAYSTDLRRSVALLQKATALDDSYAATFFELGKCYEALGRMKEARSAFVAARDLDVCPLRILSDMEEMLRRLAGRSGVRLLDAQAMIEKRTDSGIAGGEWLVDHVHPSIQGHQLIANELMSTMSELGLVRTGAGWETRRDDAWRKQMTSLGDLYFLRGQQRLENLRAWTRGEADGPPIESRLPLDKLSE